MDTVEKPKRKRGRPRLNIEMSTIKISKRAADALLQITFEKSVKLGRRYTMRELMDNLVDKLLDKEGA